MLYDAADEWFDQLVVQCMQDVNGRHQSVTDGFLQAVWLSQQVDSVHRS